MSLLTAPEFKVGLLVLIVAGIIAGMSLRVSNNPSYLGTSKEAWFYLDDASGLVKGSNVRMAGIPIGTIKDIKLDNGQAQVELLLRGEVPLTKSARIEIRPNGILGDKFVEVVAGDPRDPPLRSGEQILVVDDRASVDRLIAEVSKITKSLGSVAENIKTAMEGDSDKPLGRILGNLDVLTKDLSELTSAHKGDMGEIISNLKETTESINELVNDERNGGLKAQAQDALRRVESTMRNVDEIASKINRGEGTLGKLINDEQTVEQINSAVASINNLIESGNRLSTSLDFHSFVGIDSKAAQSTLSIRLQPGLDRYYEVGVVDDEQGAVERTVTQSTQNGVETNTTEVRRFEHRVKFNALFAKNFYNVTLKGGMIENAGGAGIDYYLFRRKLRLSAEAFDFANLNLRASARYTVFNGIYFLGGSESVLGNAGRTEAFVGAGLFLTNDDLKLLLSRMPF